MKKKIYLMDESYKYKKFSYNEISELAKELENRKITIGNSAKIGTSATIGNSATIQLRYFA